MGVTPAEELAATLTCRSMVEAEAMDATMNEEVRPASLTAGKPRFGTTPTMVGLVEQIYHYMGRITIVALQEHKAAKTLYSTEATKIGSSKESKVGSSSRI